MTGRQDLNSKDEFFATDARESTEDIIKSTDEEDISYVKGMADTAYVGAAIVVVKGVKDFGSDRQYNLYSIRQGHGRVGEDIAKENHSDWFYAPQMYQKNEPDLVTKNGQPIQVKVCKTADKTVQNLYEKGEFKYKDNIIAVPDEQVSEVQARLYQKGRTEVVCPIGASYKKICACKNRGFEGLKYDAIYAAKQPITYLVPLTVGVGSGIIFYRNEKAAAARENRDIKWSKVILKSTRCAVIGFCVMLTGCVAKGYLNRPK